MTIDGTSAPGFQGSPVVAIDFGHARGLHFGPNARGSALSSLSLVRASGAAVTLAASQVTVQGNFIGLMPDGQSAPGNGGDGIRILPGSRDNLIGDDDPVAGVSYFDTSGVSAQPVSGWQGIRSASVAGQYLITGTTSTQGLLYVGPVSGDGGTSYLVNMPGAATTSVYGPDLLDTGDVRLVGSYRTGDDTVLGFAYEGSLDDLDDAANYRTIAYPGAQFNYVHSTMGGLAVGNADGPHGDFPIGPGTAFLYDLTTDTFLPDVAFPDSLSTTAYGIWHNGGLSYTIAGGYTRLVSPGVSVARAYLVDYDAITQRFTNWTSFEPPSLPGQDGLDLATHFQGISGEESGSYTISADVVRVGSTDPGQGYWTTIRRSADGSFGPATWTPLAFPGTSGITSANSVAGNQLVGIVIDEDGFSYQATVNVGFRRSNVISGNRGNGISVVGSHDNRIAMNQIGTDASGTVPLGNRGHGIHLTRGATGNLIGGQATGGNDPTAGVFVRPLQGNLISGNHGHGVLIDGRSSLNVLSGNFIGTDFSGTSPLGNRLDGVAIVGAHQNALIGCTVQDSPFVFYNVLSGNGGNGLRVTNSNGTTVHANFMGLGADNATAVPNGANGLLVSGHSANTQVGGVIPLGNVTSGNQRNGIEVRDHATGFVSFNSFAGIAAFGGAVPNGANGILVTSTGGNNLIRTSIVSGNLANGIEIGGHATGVQVTDTGVGTSTNLSEAIPNGGSGIRISGSARHNVIGGFQPSIEPTMTVSGNLGHGIEVVGRARDNRIVHSVIGLSGVGSSAIPNGLGGILLGPGTSSTTVGGTAPDLANTIQSNSGNGVTILRSRRNAILDNLIEGNAGSGIFALGDCLGTLIAGNQLADNADGDLDLSGSRGITVLD